MPRHRSLNVLEAAARTGEGTVSQSSSLGGLPIAAPALPMGSDGSVYPLRADNAIEHIKPNVVAIKRPEIIEATANPIYLSMYQSITGLLLESRRRRARFSGVRRKAHEDHVAIVVALRAHHTAAAGPAMDDHLERMRQALQRRWHLDAPDPPVRARDPVRPLPGVTT